MRVLALLFVVAGTHAWAQNCSGVKTYSPCEMVFELSEAEAAAHPNPYLTVNLQMELRSPRFRTATAFGYWDGGRRFVVRFTPLGEGEWLYKTTSNVPGMDNKTGSFEAAVSEDPGFLRAENTFAFATTNNRKAHLWMGDTSYRFACIDRAVFDQVVAARSAQKFNHIRGVLLHDQCPKAFDGPDKPVVERFQEIDKRIAAMNAAGIFADLVIAGDEDALVKMFPEREQRERLMKYLASRYAPYHITWQGVQEFEEYTNGRALLKELGALLKKYDPYNHPRSTHTVKTSAPLLADGWMTHVLYQNSDVGLGAVERQTIFAPRVNAEFGYEDTGAGKSHPHHVDSDEFRRRLWNSTMNGEYPTFGNTGTYGGRKFEVDAKYLESPGAKAMTAWYDFFDRTRYWELEPYFDVDGGRALALGGVEYIVYIEKPGPVEVLTEKKKYEVYWYRPATGEVIQEKKDFKGERFTGQPPDSTSDWVLHLSRDGRKESMARSWKFASRPVVPQVVERNPKNVPFEVEAPTSDVWKAGSTVKFAAKLTRETRASKAMLYVWTAEATNDSQGYRVLGTGAEGEFRIPKGLAGRYPAVVNLRLYGINLNGKVYSIDRVVRVEQ